MGEYSTSEFRSGCPDCDRYENRIDQLHQRYEREANQYESTIHDLEAKVKEEQERADKTLIEAREHTKLLSESLSKLEAKVKELTEENEALGRAIRFADNEVSTRESRIRELEEAQRWIPVSEGLPEKFKKVLIRGTKGNAGIGCVDASGEIDDYSLWEGEKATHWLAIPAPSPPSPVVEQKQDQHSIKCASYTSEALQKRGHIPGECDCKSDQQKKDNV